MKKILIIDDDIELCALLEKLLGRENFLPTAAHSGESGLTQCLSGEFELVILDVMLPDISGFDVLRRIRAESGIPIIMLTAKGEEIDRVIGLEIGADDYLPKPFSSRELIARLNAVLRRYEIVQASVDADNANAPKIHKVGDLTVEIEARTVRVGGRIIELTTAEFDVLLVLVRAVGKIVLREEIAVAALGKKLAPFDRSVDMIVSKIRRKLGRLDDGIERIRSIRNAGYIYARPESSLIES